MLVDNAGGKQFEPDALLDIDTQYDARIAGFIHIGLHEKQKHDGKKFIEEFDEIEQAIVLFELTEEETFVERGAEGNKHMAPRLMPKFVKYSSHEKSGLFEMAQKANPLSAQIVKKKGQVETGKFIGHSVVLTLKNNKDGDKQSISKIDAVQKKYKANVGELQTTPFHYSVDSGCHPLEDGTATTMDDIPTWMLRFALDKALNAEEFKCLEEIEAHLEAVEAAKDNQDKLEGDDKPKADDKAEKAAAAKAKREAKAAEKAAKEAEETEADEPVEEKKPARRSRRGAAKKADAPAADEELDAILETITDEDTLRDAINDLEDLFIAREGDEDILDVIGGEVGDDDELFRDKVVEAIRALAA